MSFRGELCRSQWNRGCHPTFPYDDPYVLPPGKGEARAYKSGTICAALFVTDALPRHGVVALIQRGWLRGAAQRGRVRDLPTYLPTPFILRRHGDHANTRVWENRYRSSACRMKRDRSLGIMKLALSHSLACSARTRRSLFFTTGYYAALRAVLYNVALTYSLFCIRELDVWIM